MSPVPLHHRLGHTLHTYVGIKAHSPRRLSWVSMSRKTPSTNSRHPMTPTAPHGWVHRCRALLSQSSPFFFFSSTLENWGLESAPRMAADGDRPRLRCSLKLALELALWMVLKLALRWRLSSWLRRSERQVPMLLLRAALGLFWEAASHSFRVARRRKRGGSTLLHATKSHPEGDTMLKTTPYNT